MSNRSGINTGSKEKPSQYAQQPKRQRTSGGNQIVHPVSSSSSLQTNIPSANPAVRLEKYQLAAPEVVTLNQRIGHPDFFPLYSDPINETTLDKHKGITLSKNVAPEDTFALKSISEGFTDPMHLQDEYGSMKNKLGTVNIHEMKGKALKSIKEIEWFKGMASTKTKVPMQIQKKNAKFPSQIPCKKEFIDKWMQGLASGEPLHKLAQRVPLGHKGDNLLQALARERVPLLRATWLVKIIHQNNIQKKSEADLSIEWTICLISGLISTIKAVVSNLDLLDKSKQQFLYVLSLMNWNFHEGLLNTETLFSRLLEAFHDANKLEEISLLCCILTPYVSRMTSLSQYGKHLIQIVMEKIKIVGESSQPFPDKLQGIVQRYPQLDEQTLIQFIHASALDIVDTLRSMLHEILLQGPNIIDLFDPATKVTISKTLQIQPLNPTPTLDGIPKSAKLPFFALISPAITHGANELAFCANVSSTFLAFDKKTHPHLPYVDQLNSNIDFFQALEDFVRLVWTGSGPNLNSEFLDRTSDTPVDLRMHKLLEQYHYFGIFETTENNPNLADFVHLICTWVITGDQGDDGMVSIRSLLTASLLIIFVQGSTQDFPLQEPLNSFLTTPHAQSNTENTVVLVAQLIRRRLFSHDIFIRSLISRGIMEERDLGFQKFSNYLQLVKKLPIAVEFDLNQFLQPGSMQAFSDIEEQFQHLQNQRRSVLHSVIPINEMNEETNQISFLEQRIEGLLQSAKEAAVGHIAWFLKDDTVQTQFAQTLEAVCRTLQTCSLYIRFSIAQRLLLIASKRTALQRDGNVPILPDELIVFVKLLSSCEDWITLSQVLCLTLAITPVEASQPLVWPLLMLTLWFIKRYENIFIITDLMETVLEVYLLKSIERAKFGTDMICCVLCSHFMQYLQQHEDLQRKFAEKFPQQLPFVQQLAQPEIIDCDVVAYFSYFGLNLTTLDTFLLKLLQTALSSSSFELELLRFEWVVLHLEAVFHGKYLAENQSKNAWKNLIRTEVVKHATVSPNSRAVVSLLKILAQQFGLEFVVPVFNELVSKQLPLKADSDLEFVASLLQVLDDVISQVFLPLHPISIDVFRKPRQYFWSTLFDMFAVPIMDTFFSERCTERIQHLVVAIFSKPWFKQIWKSEKASKYASSNFNKMSTMISYLLPNFKQPFHSLHQVIKRAQPHTLEFAETLSNCTILNWKVNCLYLLALVHCPLCKAEQGNQVDNRTKELVVQIILFSLGLILEHAVDTNTYSYIQIGQPLMSSQKHCVISCRVIRSIGINLPIHTTIFRVVDDILQSNLKTREPLLQTTLNLVKHPQGSKDFVGSKSEEFVSFVLSWLAICSSDLQLIRLFVHSLVNQLRELIMSDRSAMDDSQIAHSNECLTVRLQLLEPLLGFLKKGKSLDPKLIADIATPLLRFLQLATTDSSQKLRILISQIGPRLIRIFELLLSWSDSEFNSNQLLAEFRDQIKVDYQEFAIKQRTNGGYQTTLFFALEETLPWLATDNPGSTSTSQSNATKKRVLEDTWAMLEDVEDVPLSPCSILGAVHVEKTKASSFYLHPM